MTLKRKLKSGICFTFVEFFEDNIQRSITQNKEALVGVSSGECLQRSAIVRIHKYQIFRV